MNTNISIGLNIIRIVACFMVVLLHVSAMGLYKTNPSWVYLNVIDSFCRVSVPLFIMLSGALLLREKPDSSLKVIKRILHIIACIIIWSLVYVWRDKNPEINIDSLFTYIHDIFLGPVKYHLWYLYFVVGMYIAVPIISKAYHNSTTKEVFIYLSVWFFLCSFLVFKYLFDITSNAVQVFNLSFIADIMVYLLLGKFLLDIYASKKINLNKTTLLFIFLLSSFITSLFVYLSSKNSEIIDQSLYSYISPFVIIGSSSLFILALKIGVIFDKHQKIISSASSLTLGVYCMHILFVDYFYTKFIYWNKMDMDMFFVIWSSLLIFLICMLISLAIKKSRVLSFLV